MNAVVLDYLTALVQNIGWDVIQFSTVWQPQVHVR